MADRHDKDYENEPDSAYYEEPFTLEYVLRGRSTQSRISSSIRATPWWMVSIALHLAAALILGKVILSDGPKPVDDIVITTTIKEDDVKPLDLQKIQQIFKDIKKVKTEKVVQAPLLIQEVDVEMTEVDLKDIEIDPVAEGLEDEMLDDADFMEVGDGDDVVGEVVDMPSFGVGEGSFNPRGVGSYSGVMENLAVRIRSDAKKYSGNGLVVWLVDASVSMKDDQEAIKRHLHTMDGKFREREGAGNLTQAIVYFGDKPQLWLNPTEDLDKVMLAMDHIEPNEPGTAENVMTAVTYCAKTFRGVKKGKKILVLVDDDSSDDSHLLERALQELRKSKMSLYVINRQCPFQSEWLSERFEFIDADGEVWSGTGRVHRGPESARPEIVGLGYGGITHWQRGAIMSGFGIYDQSRLAYYTGGAYYILDVDAAKAEENANMYDWELMERYRPELVSREAYDRRLTRNFLKQGIDAGKARWAQGRFPSGSMRPNGISMNLKLAENKLQQVDGLISLMKSRVIVPSDKLERIEKNRRWVGNADIMYAFLHLAKYRLRQYHLGLRQFIKENRQIPSDHIVTGGGRGKPILTKHEARDRAMCIEVIRALADRHPRTPWGRVAAVFDPTTTTDLYGYKFSHAFYFNGYWAHILFINGQRVDAYVSKIRHSKVTFRNNKGERTVPQRLIKSMERFQPKGSGGRGGGRPANPRI